MTAGSYESEDGGTKMKWAMPAWSAADHVACRVGLHMMTRKRVVTGWINYFSRVERWYCACGSRLWIWFEGGFVEQSKGQAGGHLKWIEGQDNEMQQLTKIGDNT